MNLVEIYTNNKPIGYLCFDISQSVACSIELMEKYYEIYNEYCARCSKVYLIGNTTTAKQYSNMDTLTSACNGGSYLSSGLTYVKENVKFDPNKRYIIAVICDGDNWGEDNVRFIERMKEMSAEHPVEYHEIITSSYYNTAGSRLKRENVNVKMFHYSVEH